MKFKSDKQRKAVMANMQNGNTTKASSRVPSPTSVRKVSSKNEHPNQLLTELKYGRKIDKLEKYALSKGMSKKDAYQYASNKIGSGISLGISKKRKK